MGRSEKSAGTSPAYYYLLERQCAYHRHNPNHALHAQAFEWMSGRRIVLCPIPQLGYLK
ncbi:MAG TPA: hypothetical protein VGR78_17615 [Verrucomicrobiae bacterium]|jgi:hypothetical protein|nr:hypothetical protein [Verrucomicrobiae bacterium]